MKKAIIILTLISLFILIGGSYKPLIYKIFNDYEEVCIRYRQNVTARCNQNLPSFMGRVDTYVNWSYCNKEEQNDTFIFSIYSVHHDYIDTDICIEYKLTRKTDIEPFVYLFDWCEVYPESEECKPSTMIDELVLWNHNLTKEDIEYLNNTN